MSRNDFLAATETRNPAQTEAELVDYMGSFAYDPYGWVLNAFAWGEGELEGDDGPDTWQVETLQSIGRQLVAGGLMGAVIQEAVASGHGIGKSALVAWLILWAMATKDNTRCVITANTETQLKTKTWAELAKWHRLCICRHWFTYTATALFVSSKSADGLNYEKNWRADMVPWSDKNTEAFAGLHNKGHRILLIFDEAAGIDDIIWEVAEGALTDEKTEIIWCVFGNPTRNVGRFKDCFGKLAHNWVTKQIDSRTSKFTNKAKLEQYITDYGIESDFVKTRVLGVFPSASMRQLIGILDIETAMQTFLHPHQYNFANKILTLDNAWTGKDEGVIGLRQGLNFQILKVFAKNDNDMEVASLLARYESEEAADAVFIDGGYGTGVVSAGKTMGRNWTIVWFNGKSADSGCINKRAEMYVLTQKWLKDGGCIPNDTRLRDELILIETIPRADGKIQLVSKEDLPVSTGRADALALSFAFPVTQRDFRMEKRGNRNYDPLRFFGQPAKKRSPRR